MKVLYVSGMYSTKYGGFEKFTIELSKQGIDLSVIYNARPNSQEYIDDMIKNHIKLSTVCGNILQRVWQTYRIIKRERPDIIHYHFGFVVYFLFLIIKLLYPKIKQMKTEHCEYNQNGFIYNALTKLCYGSLDCVTFVSNGVKQGVVKKIGDNEHYVVHYLGVSKSEIKNYKLRAELGIKPDEYVVTSIGFDIDVKGFDLLVQAASYLTDKQFRFKIIIVGLGEEEDCKLQRILQHYKMEDRVLSVGIRNDVDDFLYFTDIYVQPSRTEAISLSIMEALLYGIPIVGTNVGGIPEVCISGQNGYLFEKGDSIGLANALFRLLEDERLRNSFGKNSLALSEKYNREKNARKLKDIYDCLLRAR